MFNFLHVQQSWHGCCYAVFFSRYLIIVIKLFIHFKKNKIMEIKILEFNPKQQAELFKKVFGNCCDTPQTQVVK